MNLNLNHTISIYFFSFCEKQINKNAEIVNLNIGDKVSLIMCMHYAIQLFQVNVKLIFIHKNHIY